MGEIRVGHARESVRLVYQDAKQDKIVRSF